MDELEDDVAQAKLRGFSEVARVLEWVPRSPKSFDPSFVYSLQARLVKGQELTEKQMIAIKNIIIKFGIDDPLRKSHIKYTI